MSKGVTITSALIHSDGHKDELDKLAGRIADEAMSVKGLRLLEAQLVKEIGERRHRIPPVMIYRAAVRDSVKAYIKAYLELCLVLDARLDLDGDVRIHEAIALSRAKQVAMGLWLSTKLLPRLLPDGNVAVGRDGRFEPIADLKDQFRMLGMKDGMRARSIAILKPGEVLKDAPFRISKAEDREQVLDALSDPAMCCDQALNVDMALKTLTRLEDAGELEVNYFVQRLVRVRLPTHSINRRYAIKSKGAGADELSLETIASCTEENGTEVRLRIMDAPINPATDLLQEVAAVSRRTLERIDRALSRTAKVVVVPEALPLGEPRADRDLTVSQVASVRAADFLRAPPEERRSATALLTETNGFLPPGWTLACPVGSDRGKPLQHHLVQAEIRRSRRSAELVSIRSDSGLESWLVSSPGSYSSREETERMGALIQEREGAARANTDDFRRAGHRAMFHGNASDETLDSLMELNLTYTLAEDYDGFLRRNR